MTKNTKLELPENQRLIKMLKTALIMVIPIMVGIHTFSFGLYNWRQGNKVGAAGVYFLALSAVGIPFVVLMLQQ